MTPVDSAASVLQTGRLTLSLLSEPSFEECIEQGNRYHEDRAAGRIDLQNIPDEHFVAYYGGRIHGHNPDPTALSSEAIRARSIHEARLVIHYPWP